MILAAALALLGAGAQAQTEGTTRSSDIDELSGLVFSRADPTILWGHNDSGDGPVIYRIGLLGEDLGKIVIKGAQAGDWEDIAAFEDGGGPALLIADTGDDFSLRSYSTLYAVRDPGRGSAAPLLWRLDFQFPDGEHDCEAVAVDPLSREILLVTKRDRPARLYRLPLPDHTSKERQTAAFVGTLAPLPLADFSLKSPLRKHFSNMPTAFDISPDGLTAVIVTPRNAYPYHRKPGQAWLGLFQQPVAAIALPDFPQTEAGALSPDGRSLYIGSEGRPGRWARIELPSAP